MGEGVEKRRLQGSTTQILPQAYSKNYIFFNNTLTIYLH